MSEIKVTDQQGEIRSVEFEAGLSLMETLRDAGYEEIVAICGGGCSCATCHVHIPVGHGLPLPIMEEDELRLLELADNYDSGQSRLSCQIELTEQHHGLPVTIVETD